MVAVAVTGPIPLGAEHRNTELGYYEKVTIRGGPRLE